MILTPSIHASHNAPFSGDAPFHVLDIAAYKGGGSSAPRRGTSKSPTKEKERKVIAPPRPGAVKATLPDALKKPPEAPVVAPVTVPTTPPPGPVAPVVPPAAQVMGLTTTGEDAKRRRRQGILAAIGQAGDSGGYKLGMGGRLGS
jgi:hypothetical protein